MWLREKVSLTTSFSIYPNVTPLLPKSQQASYAISTTRTSELETLKPRSKETPFPRVGSRLCECPLRKESLESWVARTLLHHPQVLLIW